MNSAMIADLDAYLHRVGFQGEAHADLATLQQLTLRQPLAITFENLDAWLGRTVSLDPLKVEDKLVRRRRGGWCFEQNLLLGNALRSLGFEVEDLAARVLWGRALTDRPPRTHRLLQVHCDGRRWLADAGFGALTPTGPLDVEARHVQSTPHERYRLRPLEDDLLLEAAPVGDAAENSWLPIYRFDRTPQWPVDFEAANFQLARDPASRFVQVLVVNRATREGRYTLRDLDLEFRTPRGHLEKRTLSGVDELRQVLEQTFDIDTSELGELADRLARR